MEYEEKAEVKEEKIYNLFRCGYLVATKDSVRNVN